MKLYIFNKEDEKFSSKIQRGFYLIKNNDKSVINNYNFNSGIELIISSSDTAYKILYSNTINQCVLVNPRLFDHWGEIVIPHGKHELHQNNKRIILTDDYKYLSKSSKFFENNDLKFEIMSREECHEVLMEYVEEQKKKFKPKQTIVTKTPKGAGLPHYTSIYGSRLGYG